MQTPKMLFPVVVMMAFLTTGLLPSNARAHDQSVLGEQPQNIVMVVFCDGQFDALADSPPAGVLWARFGNYDVFIGGDVDLVGIFGIELGGGLVFDIDTPLDSGIYITGGAAAGVNLGVGVVGGVVIGGDLEGAAGGADINAGPGSVIGAIGEDGGVMIGGGVGPGGGASVNAGETGTLCVQDVVDFFQWLF